MLCIFRFSYWYFRFMFVLVLDDWLTFRLRCWNFSTLILATFQSRNQIDTEMIHGVVEDFVKRVRRSANHLPAVIVLLVHFQHQNCKTRTGKRKRENRNLIRLFQSFFRTVYTFSCSGGWNLIPNSMLLLSHLACSIASLIDKQPMFAHLKLQLFFFSLANKRWCM